MFNIILDLLSVRRWNEWLDIKIYLGSKNMGTNIIWSLNKHWKGPYLYVLNFNLIDRSALVTRRQLGKIYSLSARYASNGLFIRWGKFPLSIHHWQAVLYCKTTRLLRFFYHPCKKHIKRYSLRNTCTSAIMCKIAILTQCPSFWEFY